MLPSREWNMLFILVLKYLLLIFYVIYISKNQRHKVDKLMIEDTDSVCELESL